MRLWNKKKTKEQTEEENKKKSEAELKALQKRKLSLMQATNEELKQLEEKIMIAEKKIKKGHA